MSVSKAYRGSHVHSHWAITPSGTTKSSSPIMINFVVHWFKNLLFIKKKNQQYFPHCCWRGSLISGLMIKRAFTPLPGYWYTEAWLHFKSGNLNFLYSSWKSRKQFLGGPLHSGVSQALHLALVRTFSSPSLVFLPRYLQRTQFFCFPCRLSVQCTLESLNEGIILDNWTNSVSVIVDTSPLAQKASPSADTESSVLFSSSLLNALSLWSIEGSYCFFFLRLLLPPLGGVTYTERGGGSMGVRPPPGGVEYKASWVRTSVARCGVLIQPCSARDKRKSFITEHGSDDTHNMESFFTFKLCTSLSQYAYLFTGASCR